MVICVQVMAARFSDCGGRAVLLDPTRVSKTSKVTGGSWAVVGGGPCGGRGPSRAVVALESGACDVCVGLCIPPTGAQGRYADARNRGFWTVRLHDGVLCCDGDVKGPLAGWSAARPGDEVQLAFDPADCTLEVSVGHGAAAYRVAVVGPAPGAALHFVVAPMRGNTVRLLSAAYDAAEGRVPAVTHSKL